MNTPELDSAVVSLVLIAHLLWILWVISGAFWTRNRPLLTWFHIASLVWGIVAELGPWACPLTLAEDFLEAKSGIDPCSSGFVARYVDVIVDPAVPEVLLVWLGVAVYTVNLAIYSWRYFQQSRRLICNNRTSYITKTGSGPGT